MSDIAKSAVLCTGLLVCALPFAAAQTATPSAASDFAIHDGDRVVVYGDSITDQRLYSTFMEEYLLTRFPTWKVQWTQSGVGGDKVSGGAEGPIDLRIQRDILPYKPTVVSIMLGMNDGYYRPPNPAVQKSYEDGYKSMVNTILQGAPGVRLTLIGPSPYDDVTQPTKHYNEVMQQYSEFDRNEADRTHQGFVDFNAPVVDVLQKVETAHPDLASRLIPDRVHPGEGVHWVMAAAILKAWHAPSLVSSVTVDAHGAKAAKVENASVTDVKREKKTDELQWTEIENALPLPLPLSATDPVTDAALEAGGIEAALDQETLSVTGLAAGSYALTIDDQPVANLTADALSHGVNLARMTTPMLRQSQTLAWETEHRNALERLLFTLEAGTREIPEAAPEPEQQAMRQAIASSIAQQQKDAQPVMHHFALKPVKAVPTTT
ncbi:MAG TPA: SGNH/GDSL hydrolase family protein [Acidobacteriaceae bacterium]|nr:SGNH/GDSL hydrolase family protein [Acidobacteriaceae bacterium]